MGAIVLFPLTAALAVISKKKFEETVFPAIGIIIITLMFAGALGFLNAGVLIIPFYAVASFIILILKREEIRKYVITPGFAAELLIFIFFIFFSYGRFFVSDAALSQYGPVVRHIYETSGIRDDTLYYNLNSPFPFATLWAYYCTYTWGGFSEWVCIFANDIFISAAILPILRYVNSIKKEYWQWLLFILFSILLPILKIPEAYSCFDMSVSQSGALVYTFLMLYQIIFDKRRGCKEQSRSWYVVFTAYGFWASCTLTSLGVFTSIPLIFGACVVAFSNVSKRRPLLIAVISGCMGQVITDIFRYWQHDISVRRLLLVPMIYMGTAVCALLLTVVIDLYKKDKKKTAFIIVFLSAVGIVAFAMLIMKKSANSDYLAEWIRELADKFFVGTDEEEDYIIGRHVLRIYDASFLFLLLIVSGVVRRRVMDKEKTSDIFTFDIACIVGCILYMVYFIVYYITVIRQPEAPVQPVTAYYIAPVMILLFAVVFMYAYTGLKKEWTLIIGTIILTVCVYSDPVGAVFNRPEQEDEYPLIGACKAAGVLELSPEDRVFYVDRDLVLNLPAAFSWAVFPAGAGHISGLYYNPEPYKWSAIKEPITPEGLADIIKEGHYTYVYLKNVDDYFWETYYPVFDNWGADIRNDAIYHVEYDESGRLQIKYIAGTALEDET